MNWTSLENLTFSNPYTDGEVFEYCKDEYYSILAGQLTSGRTPERIFEDCKLGAVAEMILLEHFDFKRNPKKYYDLISSDGLETEVKVSRSMNTTVMNNMINKASNYNKSKKWIFFSYKNGVYTLFKILTRKD